jgi:hypothetical protein
MSDGLLYRRATARRPIPAPIAALPGPSLAAIERAILAAEDAARGSRGLDAAIFAALGWDLDRTDQTLGRSPWALSLMRLPRATSCLSAARALVPPGWDWGVAQRAGRPQAWCREPASARFAEKTGPTAALALARAALHAQRQVALAAMPLTPGLVCSCGWTGPAEALRPGGACPDCERRVTR